MDTATRGTTTFCPRIFSREDFDSLDRNACDDGIPDGFEISIEWTQSSGFEINASPAQNPTRRPNESAPASERTCRTGKNASSVCFPTYYPHEYFKMSLPLSDCWLAGWLVALLGVTMKYEATEAGAARFRHRSP